MWIIAKFDYDDIEFLDVTRGANSFEKALIVKTEEEIEELVRSQYNPEHHVINSIKIKDSTVSVNVTCFNVKTLTTIYSLIALEHFKP